MYLFNNIKLIKLFIYLLHCYLLFIIIIFIIYCIVIFFFALCLLDVSLQFTVQFKSLGFLIAHLGYFLAFFYF